MDLDELIRKLQKARSDYGPGSVIIGSTNQVIHATIPSMDSAWSLPIAEGSCLGDEDGEVERLFIVTVTKKETINGSE
jgi:hypothetical protein